MFKNLSVCKKELKVLPFNKDMTRRQVLRLANRLLRVEQSAGRLCAAHVQAAPSLAASPVHQVHSIDTDGFTCLFEYLNCQDTNGTSLQCFAWPADVTPAAPWRSFRHAVALQWPSKGEAEAKGGVDTAEQETAAAVEDAAADAASEAAGPSGQEQVESRYTNAPPEQLRQELGERDARLTELETEVQTSCLFCRSYWRLSGHCSEASHLI